jgi:hypothetical protein
MQSSRGVAVEQVAAEHREPAASLLPGEFSKNPFVLCVLSMGGCLVFEFNVWT